VRRTGCSSIKLNQIVKEGFSKKIHISWLIAWASLGVLIGAFASLYWSQFHGVEWFIVAICLLVVSFVNRKVLAVFIALLAGLLFGLWRGGLEIYSESGYDQFLNEQVIAVGRVLEDPMIDSGGEIQLKIVDVSVDGVQVGGKIWVGTSDRVLVKRSDQVVIGGKLTEGFGNIPAAMFRSKVLQVDRSVYPDVGRDVRDWYAQGIRESVKEPEASLGAGFLLGQKTALPENLDNNLRLLGLTHIVVASGYNLTILTRFSRRFFAKISRFTALAGSFGLVFGFVQITGFSPSMARASLIAGISLAAWYFGRKIHPLVIISFSAALTIIINPTYAWGDIGWLLSFMSFIGVIMFAPLIQTYFWGDKKPGNIRQVFIETMSAQLLTLPIIAYVFGQYSPLALLANVLILPLIPIAMGLTAAAGLAGVALSSGQTIIGYPAELVLQYMTSVIDYLSRFPVASASLTVTVSAVIIGYIIILVSMIFMWRRTGYRFREYNVVE
jgi:competence protein ComEC